MKNNYSKGFTIIELLIVIAIIAVLTSIVLVNVTAYLNNSKDAAAQANLATMVVNGAKWNDENAVPTGTYNDWITGGGTTGSSGYTNPRKAIIDAGYTIVSTCDTANCADPAMAWCACVQMKAPTTATYYCIDSTTRKHETTTDCATECSQTSATPGLCL